MSDDRLRVISVENNQASITRTFKPKTNREEVQAEFERLWNRNPKQFDPLRNCMERERLKRTFAMIEEDFNLSGKLVVDLGCGRGVFSRRLQDGGAIVDAVDIAKNALKSLEEEDTRNIRSIHDYVPSTKLEDDRYDLVVCTDLIAYIKPREHRLTINELARLVKREGYIICSTPIDIHSEDAIERFAALAETDLEILQWRFSYHCLYIRFLDFFEAPRRFARARKDKTYCEKALNDRHHLARWWFKVNSLPVIGDFWGIAKYLTSPVANWVKQSRTVLLGLEKVCRLFWSESGISHAIFMARRRPLVEPTPVESQPIERKKKRTVWE